ncbi:Gp37Gp68 family protein [Fibrella aestuarina BUZ 2]|uniref:Gp37Gp68 family protein n=1 Tax=Fibrella aestuarina BUZ 2 TaxID=1166018 RepID=I0KAS4_9BACT|nr:DUF5131 family protein [Fibrella aestuarina]CCH01227.1 Gp37Gp68 family protein [Fibrella aestuarina BUZ 2]
MATESTIEWLRPQRADGSLMPGHTGNLWWGCEEVHAGCRECYARKWANRHHKDKRLWDPERARRLVIKSIWDNLRSWQRAAQKAGEMHRVFGSMMDIYEKSMATVDWLDKDVYHEVEGVSVPLTTGFLRDRYLQTVVPATPNLWHLLLTKRPSNILKFSPPEWRTAPPQNVMFGTSISEPANLRLLDLLRAVPGRRFVSLEPQIAYIPELDLTGIDWLIVGGESGGLRRPFNPDWARRLRDISREQGVPFFMKQWDKVQPVPADLLIHEFPAYA